MKGLRFLLFGLAVILLAALGARLVLEPRPRALPNGVTQPAAQGPTPPQAHLRPASDSTRTTFEDAIRAAPDLSRAFEALRTQFPAVADRTLGEAADKLSRTGEATSPDDLLADALRDLRQGSGVLAAKSGSAALSAIFDSKAAILAELAAGDPRVCADFLFGGTSPEYADFAAAHRALEAQAALASVNATAEGRRLNQERGGPTPDDFKAIETGLSAKGLSAGEIAALLDGKSPDPPLADAKLCANARTYLDVLKTVPEDVRLRIYGATAEALARS